MAAALGLRSQGCCSQVEGWVAAIGNGSRLASSHEQVSCWAASADAPGTLRVRYGMDCAGLPLEDVAIGERARPILKLVYLVELASS